MTPSFPRDGVSGKPGVIQPPPAGRAPERSLVGCCDLRICGGVTGVAAVTGVTYGLGWEVSKLPPEPEVTPVCHLLRHLLPRPARAVTSGCFRCWSRCPTRVIGAGC